MSKSIWHEPEKTQDEVTKDKKRDKLRAKKKHYLKRRMSAMEK